MKTSEKGFTLLELCVCFIIFSIFLECIWGFYTHIYQNYYTFNRQMRLENEADNIEAFIRDSIRDAHAIEITVEGETIESDKSVEIIDKAFKKLEFKKYVDTGGSSVEKTCSIELISDTGMEQGKWKLDYVVDGTHKTISDYIESLTVSKNQDSNVVTFNCVIQQEGETNTRLIFTNTFSESITYKAHIA